MVDLIIGGHSHTKVDTEQIHNGILITQAEAKLKYATLIKLTLHPDGTLQREWELLEVGNKGNAKPEIAAMVAEYNNNPYMNEVLAHNPYPLTSAEQVGYWMADALQATAGTDLALINFGGVRQPYLPAGNVTRKDVLTIDPFGNQVVTLTLTGHELKAFITALFHNDVKGIMFPSNGFKIAYTLSPDDDELRDLQILHADGTPIDMDQTYTVASNSYVVSTAIFQHAQPDITHTTTTAEGWVKWLQEEASTVPDYRQVVRTTTHH